MVITDRGFEVMVLLAFRYGVNRHCTQCLTTGGNNSIAAIIIDNIDKINTNFKCQMMNDINSEYFFYDNIDDQEKCGCKTYQGKEYEHTVYSPHYLDGLYNKLKEDYRKNHNGKEWREGVQV